MSSFYNPFYMFQNQQLYKKTNIYVNVLLGPGHWLTLLYQKQNSDKGRNYVCHKKNPINFASRAHMK